MKKKVVCIVIAAILLSITIQYCKENKETSKILTSTEFISYEIVKEYKDNDVKVVLYTYEQMDSKELKLGISVVENNIFKSNLSSGYPKEKVNVTAVQVNNKQKYIIYGRDVEFARKDIKFILHEREYNVVVDNDGCFLEVICDNVNYVNSNTVPFSFHIEE